MTTVVWRVLLFPTMIAPVNNAIPRSPGFLKRVSEEIADSIAPCTFFRVDFDLMFAA